MWTRAFYGARSCRKERRANAAYRAIDTPHQFVFVPDVGLIACRLLAADGAWGHTWNFAGSGTATQRELVTKIYAMSMLTPIAQMTCNMWV